MEIYAVTYFYFIYNKKTHTHTLCIVHEYVCIETIFHYRTFIVVNYALCFSIYEDR